MNAADSAHVTVGGSKVNNSSFLSTAFSVIQDDKFAIGLDS